MPAPTEAETYAKLMEHLRLAQEASATLAHLAGYNSRSLTQRGWLAVSEQLKRAQGVITSLAMGKMH